MEKINIAELLKDCPKGMELDCTMFDNVTFVGVNAQREFPIEIKVDSDTKYLTKEGCYHRIDCIPSAKCVIFPKGRSTWDGFKPPCSFMDGDIVATTNGYWIGITEGGERYHFIPTYCVIKIDGKFEAYFGKKEKWRFNRFATEEEKAKLFKAIKDNGYKWNAETKTLEKLPKFKVGNRVKHKDGYFSGVVTEIDGEYFRLKYDSDAEGLVNIRYQDEYELVPNKFDISTLKPFKSRVLVRDYNSHIWRPAIWGLKTDDINYPYTIVGGVQYSFCIPYEGNEHLLGKTNDCDDFYKTWK